MVDMYSQIQLIYEFSSTNQKLSKEGYSVSSLEVSLESILQELDDPNKNYETDTMVQIKEEEDHEGSVHQSAMIINQEINNILVAQDI